MAFLRCCCPWIPSWPFLGPCCQLCQTETHRRARVPSPGPLRAADLAAPPQNFCPGQAVLSPRAVPCSCGPLHSSRRLRAQALNVSAQNYLLGHFTCVSHSPPGMQLRGCVWPSLANPPPQHGATTSPVCPPSVPCQLRDPTPAAPTVQTLESRARPRGAQSWGVAAACLAPRDPREEGNRASCSFFCSSTFI